LFFLLGSLIFNPSAAPAQTTARPQKADLPAPDEIRMWGALQDSRSEWRYLKGAGKIETTDFDLSADEIDYNSDTRWAYARGHVHLEHFATGDKLDADHGEYNLKTEEGTFYAVDGTSPSKIMARPGILTTTNPFYFQARWAERIKDRYILHHGYVTDCKIPKPWWTFEAPMFDIIPGDRAIARHTVFRVKRVPIIYLPYFYRPLGRNPRSSGFLTPNIGHSSIFGWMVGAGYYWAINRSYDMTGVVQYFTDRGPALRYNFRGKPNEVTDFSFNLYGVKDRGVTPPGGTFRKEGGVEFNLAARTEVGGFHGVLDYTYLSSYLFRQAFFYSPSSTIWSQNNSIGYLQRHFDDDVYTLNLVLQRTQNYNSITYQNQLPNQIIVQKLPSVEFSGRDQEIAKGSVPVWFSFGSTAGLLTREEPTVETNGSPTPEQLFRTGAVGRIDIRPRVMTEFDIKGFSFTPSMTLGVTDYTNSYATNTTMYAPGGSCGDPTCPVTTVALRNANLIRKDADFALDLRFPALARIYRPPKWLHLGEKAKHVIEAQATYEYVTGINQFRRTILFDATDILSNTNQVTYSMNNRLYTKDKRGNVKEVVTWRLVQGYYFDPTFGGTVIAGQRNVVLAIEEITPYTFLDRPRSYSPVISSLVVNPYSFLSMEYRAEYDPLNHKFLDHTLGASVRYSKYFAGVSQTAITTNPLLIPQQNQLSFGGGYGNSSRKGWNVAGSIFYDTLHNRRLFDFVQTSYNTDCCGFSFELRNFNLGIRQENQYFFSFSVANIGTFGSLQRQARIF
jgi:LPS-assembly protein